MRILIVGCGYLGLRAAQMWDEQGAEIVAVTRSPVRAAEWSSRGWEPVVGDITQPETLANIKPIDFCLYAVGYDRHTEHSKRAVYIDGLRFTLQQLRRKTPRLLYISSSSVYGQDDGTWVDETSPCEPRTESGQICLEAEHLLETAASPALGVMVLIVRNLWSSAAADASRTTAIRNSAGWLARCVAQPDSRRRCGDRRGATGTRLELAWPCGPVSSLSAQRQVARAAIHILWQSGESGRGSSAPV